MLKDEHSAAVVDDLGLGAPKPAVPPNEPGTQLITAEQFILQQRMARFPTTSGEFSWLLSGITLATKMVAAQVRRAGLTSLLGSAGEINVQGETVQRLDVFANQALLHCLGNRGNVGVLASEENEQPVIALQDPEGGKYIVVFDPLDGSSNIDVNVNVGTIFSIMRRDMSNTSDPGADVLQQGTRQIAAGYVVYGSSTMLVYTTGDGVHGFTLDPAIGAYVLSHPNMQMPDRGNLYSTNEANADSYPEYCRRFLHWLKSGEDGTAYSSRYIGSLVADFHRTLLKGGIFLYPPTSQYPKGKLRLLYEANPIAMLAEQAGGRASDGQNRILDIEPTDLHQRVPLFVGSRYEMDRLEEFARRMKMR
ncbi:MAG: class 1 fructose-bisphosphatase [Planctomycetia bacterium]|nr:class 1 fructose-bisphosphatase [Planctomycetia bacterium]